MLRACARIRARDARADTIFGNVSCAPRPSGAGRARFERRPSRVLGAIVPLQAAEFLDISHAAPVIPRNDGLS